MPEAMLFSKDIIIDISLCELRKIPRMKKWGGHSFGWNCVWKKSIKSLMVKGAF